MTMPKNSDYFTPGKEDESIARAAEAIADVLYPINDVVRALDDQNFKESTVKFCLVNIKGAIDALYTEVPYTYRDRVQAIIGKAMFGDGDKDNVDTSSTGSADQGSNSPPGSG